MLNVKHGWAPVPAILAGLVVGAAIGLFQGSISTRFGMPSFVVTLAGLLGWQGVQLKVLGDTGTVNLNPGLLTDLAGTFFGRRLGWIVAVVCVVAVRAGDAARLPAARGRAGLAAPPSALRDHPHRRRRDRRVRCSSTSSTRTAASRSPC